jgi:hypothetical protein
MGRGAGERALWMDNEIGLPCVQTVVKGHAYLLVDLLNIRCLFNGSFLPQIQGCKFSFAIFTHGALPENSVPNHRQNPRTLLLPELGHVANHIAVTREWFLSPELSSQSQASK